MARRRILFSKIRMKAIGEYTVLLQIDFTSGSEELAWTPKWDEIREIFDTAICVESYNTNGRSIELGKFGMQAKSIAEYIQVG